MIIIVEAEMSLDGVIGGNNPEFWAQLFKHHGEDVKAYLKALLFTADALLMGRETYEGFAQVWPTRAGDEAAKINAMPKHVASRTLKGPLAWNASLIEGDVAQRIGALKRQPTGNLVQYGIGELTETMLEHGLVDELRLVVYPFVFGQGKRAFENFAAADLTLVSTRAFENGAIACHYRPKR
jgi:dihydrofolate reductase